MAKTLRVHTLAKELGVTSKEVIDKCRAEGVELKNHMAAISAGLAESIREWFSAGQDVTSIEVGDRVDVSKVRRSRKKAAEPTADTGEAAVAVAEPGESPAPEFPESVPEAVEAEKQPQPEPPAVEETAPPDLPPPVAEPQPEITAAPPAEVPAEPVQEPVATPPPHAPEPPRRPAPTLLPPPPPPPPVKPAGPQVVPRPAELKGPRVVRIEAPEPVRAPRTRQAPAARGPSVGVISSPGPAAGRKGRARGHGQSEEGEGSRIRSRSPRRHGRTVDVGERLKEWHEQDLLERKERLASATGMGLRERRAAERRRAAAAAAGVAAARKAPIELTAPIALKEFCSAVGIPFSTVSQKLLEHTNRLWRINENIDAETLELLTMELGVLVTIAKQKTALERLKEEFDARPREHLKPRPPVVAMLGHVDHGKTSLLDAIRKADVAAGEAGGITQHIGAYRVERGEWRVTFLDTPGHEAFTAMRARGANLTDVVVLVVAADDGVMPQTIEAINHARAAGVQIVVALNKIDLPNADVNRVYSQLAAQELIPSEWGGQTDVIKTSATTGQGVDDLIAHLSTLSDLMELRADPTVPASATVIESQMKEGQGVAAKVLVREGTLRTGQIVVCGGGYGRIRMLRDDKGRRIKEASPGWPVEVSGLDELPQAADQMYQVDDLKQAKDIAEEMRQRRREAELEGLRKPRTLEDLLAAGDESQIPELNLIIKADVQGSVDVLKKSVSELPREKAQSRVLHAAVGAISEADVQLARASNALIIGFHVVAEDRARQLAEELGVQIRLYRVIYEMLDDVHKALAGLLEPVQRQEVRGAAEVRKLFNITRVGLVAGCRVTSGVVHRNHLMRVIRDGRVVADNRAISSLRHVKDDVREVRAGLECGIKLEGFDDIKPGDVLEAYEVVQVAQEL